MGHLSVLDAYESQKCRHFEVHCNGLALVCMISVTELCVLWSCIIAQFVVLLIVISST